MKSSVMKTPKLSYKEIKNYERIHGKIMSTCRTFGKSDFINVFLRGLNDTDICEKVWEASKIDPSQSVISKSEFYTALKYLAALQNNYKFEDIVLEDLPELPIPNLSRKQKEEGKDSKESTPGLPETEIIRTISSPGFKGSLSNILETIEEKEKEKPAKGNSDGLNNGYADSLMDSMIRVQQPTRNYKPVLSEDNVLVASTRLDNPFGNKMNDSVVLPNGSENKIDGSLRSNELDSNASAKKTARITSSYHDYMKNKQKIRIEIVDSKDIASGPLGLSSFTLYVIKAKYDDHPKELVSEHRYSDFEWLDRYLRSEMKFKGLNIPFLPVKKAFGNRNPTFIEQRKQELEHYLKELGRHHVLYKDEILREFFTNNSENFEQVKEKIVLPGIFAIDTNDIISFSKAYEYINASIKARIKKDEEGVAKDVGQAQSIHNRLRELGKNVDNIIKALQKNHKQSEIFTETSSAMRNIKHNFSNDDKNPLHAQLMNFCDMITNYVSNKVFEITRDENLLMGLTALQEKIHGLQNGHGVFIQNLKMNEELRNDKENKILKYTMENKETKKLEEEKRELDNAKINQEKEIKIAIGNLQEELNELEIIYTLIMNEEIDSYLAIQDEYWVKYQNNLNSDKPENKQELDLEEFSFTEDP